MSVPGPPRSSVINVRITPQADLSASSRHVAECTQPDSCTAAKPSLDRLVSAGKQRRGNFEAESLRGRRFTMRSNLVGCSTGCI
jgi:hypothetical protein